MSTWRKLGGKQAHCVIHQPVSVVSQCGAGARLYGLANGDQHQLTGDNVLYKSTLYFTILYLVCMNNYTHV